MSGIETIPLRIPDEWDPKWFEVLVRDVLALADIRNAKGIGLTISGTSDIVATLEGAGTGASFVVIAANAELTDERVLAIEATVLSLTDNGANSTVVIGVAEKGISYAKIQDISATDKLLGRATAGAGIIEEIALTAAGRALIDDANAAAQRTTLDVDQAGTDNSTDVTLAGTPDYLTIAGQVITLGPIDLTTDVSSDLPVADGGTGSSSAGGARTNLGLVIGTDVQAFDATLLSLAALGTAADKLAYTTALDTWAETAITAAGRALLDDASASAQRTTLSAASRTQAIDIPIFLDIQDGNGDYVLQRDYGFGFEIDDLASCILDTGTCTVKLKINTTEVGGIDVSATTTEQATADPSTSASTVVAGDDLKVNITNYTSAPATLEGTIHCTRTLA